MHTQLRGFSALCSLCCGGARRSRHRRAQGAMPKVHCTAPCCSGTSHRTAPIHKGEVVAIVVVVKRVVDGVVARPHHRRNLRGRQAGRGRRQAGESGRKLRPELPLCLPAATWGLRLVCALPATALQRPQPREARPLPSCPAAHLGVQVVVDVCCPDGGEEEQHLVSQKVHGHIQQRPGVGQRLQPASAGQAAVGIPRPAFDSVCTRQHAVFAIKARPN